MDTEPINCYLEKPNEEEEELSDLERDSITAKADQTLCEK